jgi:hypothetical protein
MLAPYDSTRATTVVATAGIGISVPSRNNRVYGALESVVGRGCDGGPPVALGVGKFRNVITLFGRKGKARVGYLDRLSPPLSDRPTRRPLSLEPTPRRLRQAHKGENRP